MGAGRGREHGRERGSCAGTTTRARESQPRCRHLRTSMPLHPNSCVQEGEVGWKETTYQICHPSQELLSDGDMVENGFDDEFGEADNVLLLLN